MAQLSQPGVIDWIKEHLKDAPAQLMLQAHRFPGIPVREAVQQIQARQKLKKKLPLWADNLSLVLPPALSAEQASSAETAAFKASLVAGESFADITGGLGADAFALAAKFAQGNYVEQETELVQLARHNAAVFGINNISFFSTAAETFLNELTEPLDLIYLDPARRDEANRKLVSFADCSPDVIQLLPTLLAKSKQVLVKASPMLDLKGSLLQLGQHTEAVHIVVHKNELKELLFLLQQDPSSAEPQISVHHLSNSTSDFSFTLTEEQNARVALSQPLRYLFEPNTGLMKAGAYKLLAERFGVFKLHPNSHLYTSATLVPDFPGRTYEIVYSGKPNKKLLTQAGIQAKANVSTRNYPIPAEALAKKLGLAPGKAYTVFGTTTADGKPCILGGKLLT